MCSPVGYADSGFAGLAKYKGAELRKILGDAGVSCVSSHFGIDELRKDQQRAIDWAKDVGLTQMLVPSLDGPEKPTMDDVKRAADEYNKMGEQAAKAGIQQGLHNEGFELSMVDGKRTYDVLLDLLDPKLVKFQFQVSTISRGYDAAEYFTKYPGRFISMHVQGWSAATKKIAPVGQDYAGLEEDLYRGENGRHQELLCRDESRHDESQRSLSSQSAGLRVVAK